MRSLEFRMRMSEITRKRYEGKKKTIEKECLTCKNKFFTYPGKREHKYCSINCVHNDKNYVNSMKGKKRPDFSDWNKKNKSEQIKEWWSNPLNKEKILERNKKISLLMKGKAGNLGEKNGRWLGGISKQPYTWEFNNELKLAVKIRDNYKCKICKKDEKNMKEGLKIHHINYNKKDNRLDNLISLCNSCHSKTNHKRVKWIEYFSREYNIEKQIFTWEDINKKCNLIIEYIKKNNIIVNSFVPIPKGGIIPAVILSTRLNVPIKEKVENNNDIIIDEIVDFGITFKKYKKLYPNNLFFCIHLNKINFNFKQKPDFFVEEVDKYTIYPWE